MTQSLTIQLYVDSIFEAFALFIEERCRLRGVPPAGALRTFKSIGFDLKDAMHIQ